MGDVLSKEKREQVIGLGRLGWSLRRIEQATRSTSGDGWDYLRSAGKGLRAPGGWGRSVCESQELPSSSFKFGEVQGFCPGTGVIKSSTNRC
jgi:hypothetical protein